MSAAPAPPDDEDVSEDMHQQRRGPERHGQTLTDDLPVGWGLCSQYLGSINICSGLYRLWTA